MHGDASHELLLVDLESARALTEVYRLGRIRHAVLAIGWAVFALAAVWFLVARNRILALRATPVAPSTGCHLLRSV